MRFHALRFVTALVLGLFVAPALAEAQPQAPNVDAEGLFLPLGNGRSAEIRGALPGTLAGADVSAPVGVLRSRRVALDIRRLDAIALDFLEPPGGDPAQDAAPLLLNLFDDTAVEVLVDSVTPAALENGYVVSGSVRDQLGSVVLVVHFDSDDEVLAVSGSASAAEGAFRISTIDAGTYAIEEIDTAVPWIDGVLPDEPDLVAPPLPPSPDVGGGVSSLTDPALAANASEPSEIDVLVLYTTAAAEQAGGEASMRAQVDVLLSETNRAFAASDVAARVTGWARKVSYVESGDLGTDVSRLRQSRDGQLDEAHRLRFELGADLVHLLVAFTPEKSDDGSYSCGVGYTALHRDYAFGVTLSYRGCQYTFAHELGHNLGLHHDRYQQFTYETDSSPAHVPYAYGYSNAATFSPVGGGRCWSTVMAYYKHCYDVPGGRDFHEQLLSFSNPYTRHQSSGEPMGVLGEEETREVDGPANAARALEAVSSRVARYFDRRQAPPSIGVDLAVRTGTVSVSPVVVDVGERVTVQASVANVGSRSVSSSTAWFWSKYDEAGAEWVRHSSIRLGLISPGASRTLRWRGTGGSDPGTEYWAVCIATSGDVDDDNNCVVAAETVAIRDPDAVDGAELVTESSGDLAVGDIGEIEFAINDITGEEFQIQPHWFLLSFEPVDEDVYGVISKWECYEDDRQDCWNPDGTENEDADWDWRTRAWGFGSEGTFVNLLGLEAYQWSEDDKWQFRFGEATRVDEDADTEINWRFAVLRVTEDDEGGEDSASGAAAGVAGTVGSGLAPVVGAQPPGVSLQIPPEVQDALRHLRTPR